MLLVCCAVQADVTSAQFLQVPKLLQLAGCLDATATFLSMVCHVWVWVWVEGGWGEGV
jgi:hypothetical protein